MATSEDITKFQELSNKDRILCTTRDHTRYLQGSNLVMELVDVIHEINLAKQHLSGLDALASPDMDRSCILVVALRDYRNRIEAELESQQLAMGVL